MLSRLSMLLAFSLAVAGCAAPAVQTPPVAAPAPLQALYDYRLQALGTAAPVLAVAPPVAGQSILGDRFRLRPETHEVLRFDSEGALSSWGGLGTQAGRFNRPEGLAVSLNRLYVADTGNHRVQAFAFDGSPAAQWGSFGLRPGQFVHPRSVELLSDGRVVVTDDYRVQYFEADGTFVIDFPIALPVPGVEASAGAAQTRDELLTELHEVKAEIAEQLRHLDGPRLATYRAALAEAVAELRDQTQARYAAAVLSAALLRLVDQALPAAPTEARKVQTVVGNVSGIGAIRLSGMDLETALMMVQTNRTNLLENQVGAQIEEIQRRQQEIARLNKLMSELRARQPVNRDGAVTRGSLGSLASEFPGNGDVTRAQFDQRIQAIKATIDALSNTMQMDMLRLQSLSNKRNEAFEVMTNFMKKMKDQRDSVIRNIG